MSAHPIARVLAGASLWIALATLAAPYTVSADGKEVTDHGTGLIWRRCAEGESGTDCRNGMAVPYTHEAALAHARTQTGWRLPTVKELASLVDRGRSEPALDVTIFPLWYRRFYHWTSTPYSLYPDHAWFVTFGDGTVSGAGRQNAFYVRLVR